MGLAALIGLAMLPIIMGTITQRLCDIKFHRRPILLGLLFSIAGGGLYLTKNGWFLAAAYVFLILIGPWRPYVPAAARSEKRKAGP